MEEKEGMKYAGVTFGFVEAVLNKLGGVEGAQRFLRGELKLGEASESAITSVATEAQGHNIINCDAAPFVPNGWTVESHQSGGQLKWNADKVELWLSGEQKNGRTSNGEALRKELTNKPALNANVLDYLLAHPELIPEEWKGKLIFFWATIYRSAVGGLCVRSLDWSGEQWDWRYRWLGHRFDANNPAAVSRK